MPRSSVATVGLERDRAHRARVDRADDLLLLLGGRLITPFQRFVALHPKYPGSSEDALTVGLAPVQVDEYAHPSKLRPDPENCRPVGQEYHLVAQRAAVGADRHRELVPDPESMIARVKEGTGYYAVGHAVAAALHVMENGESPPERRMFDFKEEAGRRDDR